jgi:ATP-dependent DNA helicase DinG
MGFESGVSSVLSELEALAGLLETQAQRSEGLDSCWRRAGDLLLRVRSWQNGANADFVRWGETHTHSLQLNATPLVIAEIMQKQMSGHPRAWIFTSATLAVQDDFGHYCAEMGLADASSARWESPFDYPIRPCCTCRKDSPSRTARATPKRWSRPLFPCSRPATGGRSFCAPRCARCAARTNCSAKQLERAGLELPLLLQGERSKNELLERFRRLGNAILIGSQSFWEGVDVRGEALSLVVIDKLPLRRLTIRCSRRVSSA